MAKYTNFHENYGFVHADLKYDNIMVDISTVTESSTSTDIRIKNFDFDLSMFAAELLPLPGVETTNNPAKHRPRYFDGLHTNCKIGATKEEEKPDFNKLNKNDFWWPPMLLDNLLIPQFDRQTKTGSITLIDPKPVQAGMDNTSHRIKDLSTRKDHLQLLQLLQRKVPGTENIPIRVQELLLTFDLWRLFLGFQK